MCSTRETATRGCASWRRHSGGSRSWNACALRRAQVWAGGGGGTRGGPRAQDVGTGEFFTTHRKRINVPCSSNGEKERNQPVGSVVVPCYPPRV
eukprot:scaffold13243_cov72-Phaeocystis_antarctica.AAC.1